MDKYHNHLHGMQDGMRMLYRTRHIFILLAGLLNIGIGSYFTYRSMAWGIAIQVVGSVLIVVASILFVVAFFYEPTLTDLKTPLSHWGMYSILAGTSLHFFSTWYERK
jgi:hypothetical protein